MDFSWQRHFGRRKLTLGVRKQSLEIYGVVEEDAPVIVLINNHFFAVDGRHKLESFLLGLGSDPNQAGDSLSCR